ncbi:hypothetical protein HQQ94_06865 [Shewanella sp. VB17]|uniref:hypothetical protein n=1 Tax=Shewanella sp. VB17 TaxID=2739432 RepID=UPI001564683D|nr:hypothetical protein [Shewanella sp. VB17]NRD72963.1 hypothetical protein [Shewanella sp. VB17]
MSNQIKLVLAISAALSLSGCLEVEDNNNNDAATVTLSGTVKGATDDVNLSDAQASIKFAGKWSTPVQINDAKLLLEKQAAFSDFMLKLESPSDAFVTMVYKGETKEGLHGEIKQDLGEMIVGKPKEKLLTLLQTGDNTYVEDLEVYSLYVTDKDPYALELQQPDDVAVYTEATGEYKLTLPEGIPSELHAKLDVDNDGVDDFALEVNLSEDNSEEYTAYDPEYKKVLESRLLSADKVWDENTLYLKEINALREYDLRLTLLSEDGSTLAGARVAASGNDDGNTYFDYDSTTAQYVVEARYRGKLNIVIPSFEVGELAYSNAQVIIDPTEFEQQYKVSISGVQAQSFYTEVVDGELNLAVTLSMASYQIPAITVLSSKVKDNNLEMFFSAPVALVNNEEEHSSVELTSIDAVKIIAGNTVNEQGVTPGDTYIELDNRAIATKVVLTLNGTKLTASPVDAALAEGEYQYKVGKLVNTASGTEENIANSQQSFVVYNNEFDINDVVLDNSNFTTNGIVIEGKNTAGEEACLYGCSGSGSAQLFFPLSINSLKDFTLTLTSYVENGVNNEIYKVFNVVKNDALLDNLYKKYVVKAAENERIDRNSISIQTGTSLASGYRYSTDIYYVYLYDDTASQSNSATFDYSYTTKAGVTQTGTVTYKVK